jgi:aldehyde dehydrogenase
MEFRSRYQNFIGGEWVRPYKEQYFENITPVTGRPFCEVPRSTSEDIERAIDAAYAAKTTWCKTPITARSLLLNKIADRIEQNREKLAVAETWDCGKPIRETLTAEIPLVVDCFRYFASCLRAQEGTVCELDEGTVAYNFHEPLGVVGQILPWSFPLLMAACKLAPALAAGNCVVLCPSEYTPASTLCFAELIQDLLPPGVLNIVNGYCVETGKWLASNKRISKLAFAGEGATGRLVLQCAAENLTPVALEVGGNCPGIFFEDICAKTDEIMEKAIDCFSTFAYSQGEMGACPTRCLIDEKVYSKFMDLCVARTKKLVPGNPLDPATTVGALVCKEYLDRCLAYVEQCKKEGAKLLWGGERAKLSGDVAGGYYMTPTVFQAQSKMKCFQDETCGPVCLTTSFKTFDEAIKVANDAFYGLGATVWTRDNNVGYRAGRAVQCGRVWMNSYHPYPAYAAFCGYKPTGFGRDYYSSAIEAYQQPKCLFWNYDSKPQF